ncbi:MAG: hypothetical protein ABI208_07945 [Ginsengibacter sp.]|jgi:GNAT superfamily N-acetyltransferase
MKRIQLVTSKKELKWFIDFPHELYKNDPYYVPELFIAQRDLLTKHPFLKHSEIALYLAFDGDQVVGRIAAILNNNHNSFNQTKDGFFGFFDTINDIGVVQLLVNKAEEWLKAKGVTKIMGPMNPSTNESVGLLVDGFNSSPVAMMTYNFSYYQSLLEEVGFKKMEDLIAYDFDMNDFDDKPLKVMNVFRERLERKGITIRLGNLKNFDQEVEGVRLAYNQAWDKNMGFVPMTDEEFRYLAKDLKLVLDKDFLLVAEHAGKIIGFALCIPDVNQIQKDIKRGRLFPTGLWKLLTRKSKIKGLRIIALGVTEHYRRMGIEAVFYGIIMQKAVEKGIKNTEASWILEDNELMNRAIINMKGRPYKRYRIYEKNVV